MLFTDFFSFQVELFSRFHTNNQGMRKGQFLMNELSKVNLNLYRSVPPDLDPFYNDELVGACLRWLADRWEPV